MVRNKKYHITNDEIVNLIQKWKKTNSNNIKNEIVKKMSFFICSKNKKYKNDYFYNDLIQESNIGLINAIQKFDIKKGMNFFKLASWYILNRRRIFLKWVNKNDKEVNYFNYNIDEKSPDIKYEIEETKQSLLNIIDNLPELYKNVLVMRLDNYTFQQIGNRLSYSKQFIEKVQKRAINEINIRILEGDL